MKTAFLFAGQGSQYIGMGKDLYENYTSAKKVFDEVETIFPIKELCFKENSKLNDTRYTQIAIYTVSMAITNILQEKDIYGDVCAGLSLGEYSALCYGRSNSLLDGAKILLERGRIMADALPKGSSAMAAILMLEEETILKVCKEVQDIGICEIANYNSPTQIVISGETQAVQKASELCCQYGARRALPLNVSGAFHCSLLNQASEELRHVLNQYKLKPTRIPVYHNLSGKVEERDLVNLLSLQINHAVRLQQTIENMVADGVTTFVEIGPGKVISGFVKKCCEGKEVRILHVEDEKSLKESIQILKGAGI